MSACAPPTGVERFFDEHDIIVSKTDLRGVITYANTTFQRLSGFTEDEILGRPHSLVRHPDMPRCVFELLWDRVQGGHEVFAYVVNLAKTGDHYWVLAHVTPSLDHHGRIVGYHSNRRVPGRAAVDAIRALYAELRAVEAADSSKKAAVVAGRNHLNALLDAQGSTYDAFVWSLARAADRRAA